MRKCYHSLERSVHQGVACQTDGLGDGDRPHHQRGLGEDDLAFLEVAGGNKVAAELRVGGHHFVRQGPERGGKSIYFGRGDKGCRRGTRNQKRSFNLINVQTTLERMDPKGWGKMHVFFVFGKMAHSDIR